ncbi:Uncharacterised protein [Helicobacter fennelliae]|uniref:Uncharacterized protein n=1 Tax=Helicobacter fennelliae TaxID=215 RepID=A0A2X3EIV2_9HELI|nr:hypothetical protein [Helicobacter fennelliae]SQC36423.1 Uncharacterised protein [Helicobacter fennelliae]
MDKQQELLSVSENLANLIFALQKEVKALKQENKDLIQDLGILKSCIEILSTHISVLEQKNKGFRDRFKLGIFKTKSINEDLKQELSQLKATKEFFTLNDD